MEETKATKKMLNKISKCNMELDGRADYRRGLRTERKRIIKFIEEEKRLKEVDDRHTDRFISGFTSACNIILGQLE